MSRLVGSPGDRWTLSVAVDALVESARRAARPGWLWAAGFFLPSLAITGDVIGLFLGLLREATGLRLGDLDVRVEWDALTPWEGVGPHSLLGGLLTLPLMLVAQRLVAGLCYVAGPEVWDELAPEGGERRIPRLRSAWRAGRGLTVSAFGLWLAVQGLTLAAVLVTLGPVVVLVGVLDLDRAGPAFVLLSPLALLLFVYGLVLQVVNQLALHSLACNRRGVASAMGHAWRLIRNAPWAVVRGSLVDLFLSLIAYLAASALAIGFCVTCVLAPLIPVAVVVLYGLAGVVRAGYWARFYRALGGLTPSDRVPGLEDPGLEDTAWTQRSEAGGEDG